MPVQGIKKEITVKVETESKPAAGKIRTSTVKVNDLIHGGPKEKLTRHFLNAMRFEPDWWAENMTITTVEKKPYKTTKPKTSHNDIRLYFLRGVSSEHMLICDAQSPHNS